MGCGSTARATVVDHYYQVTEVDEDHVEICLLDFADRPVGKGLAIPKDCLKKLYPMPGLFQKQEETSRTSDRGARSIRR